LSASAACNGSAAAPDAGVADDGDLAIEIQPVVGNCGLTGDLVIMPHGRDEHSSLAGCAYAGAVILRELN
jgi:hypothetical protein